MWFLERLRSSSFGIRAATITASLQEKRLVNRKWIYTHLIIGKSDIRPFLPIGRQTGYSVVLLRKKLKQQNELLAVRSSYFAIRKPTSRAYLLMVMDRATLIHAQSTTSLHRTTSAAIGC